MMGRVDPYGVKMGRILFPYCVKRMPDGKCVILNRNYKPIGVLGESHIGGYVDYSKFSFKIDISDAFAKKVSCDGKGWDRGNLYFYGDLDNPFRLDEPAGAHEKSLRSKALERVLAFMNKIFIFDPSSQDRTCYLEKHGEQQ